jgi:two-component system response regulator TctD
VRILLADKDQALAVSLTATWPQNYRAIDYARDGAAAEHLASSQPFDVVLLNWDLPVRPGFEVLANLRAARNRVPVLMLSDTCSLEKRVWGLNTGADDFMTKPLAPAEVHARLTAVLRRSGVRPDPQLAFGQLVFNRDTLVFQLDGAHSPLTPREHTALLTLLEKPGQAVPRHTLVQRVFTAQGQEGCDGIEVVMHRLRKKLAQASVTVETCRGIGYRLRECASA